MCWNLWKKQFSYFHFLKYGQISWKIVENILFFCSKRCAMFWNGCIINFHSYEIFSLWDMVGFVIKVSSEISHPPSGIKYSRTMQIFYLIILVKVFSNVQHLGDNVLKSMKKQFSYFQFLRFSRFCAQNS